MRNYDVRQDEVEPSKWTVWCKIAANRAHRATPGLKLDDKNLAQIVADALNDAYTAGIEERAFKLIAGKDGQ